MAGLATRLGSVVRPRSAAETVGMARRIGSLIGIVLLAIVAIYPVLTNDAAQISQFIYIGIFGIVAIGLNFTLGYAGEFALGQAGIFAAGAYTAGILTAEYAWPFTAALVFAVVVAAAVGLIAGLPGLRVGGWYFALTSLFIAVVIPDIAKESPHTGGTQGFGGIPFPSFFGHALDSTQIYLFVLISTAISLVLLANLVRSRWGLAFMSMRQSNKGAEASGISVFRLKLVVYVLASVLAGYAGAILPHVDGYLSPDAFPLSLSIMLIAGVTIGGMGSLVGPVVGVGLLQILPRIVSGFDKYSLLIYGGILIVAMLILRRGILPTLSDLWVSAVLWLARRTGRVVDEVAPPATTSRERRAAAMAAHRYLTADADGALAQLTARGVSKQFGGLHALRSVDLDAKAGAVTAVIGPNGSGKTTLLNMVLGFYRADAGDIRIGSRRLSGLKPYRVARAGVARTFQTPVVMPERTCRENVMSGAFCHRRVSLAEVMLRLPRARSDWRAAREMANDLLAFVGLAAVAGEEAGSLSAGQQRLLEIARALATRPTVLLLDEPAAGLVGSEVAALAEVLRELREHGFVVVLVEHNVNLVMAVADHVTVLDQGRVIASADPATVQQDPAVLECYLGEAVNA